MCTALQVRSLQCGRNISILEVAQSYSVSLRALFGKDPTRPNFCSTADGAIIHGGVGSPGSPYLILWNEALHGCLPASKAIMLRSSLPTWNSDVSSCAMLKFLNHIIM